MKMLVPVVLLFFFASAALGQNPSQKIYETEKAFEKIVAEKGINTGFIEFLAPDGIMFSPEAVNGRERWRSRPASPAALTWNPIWIDYSSNGALAYSIGNSIYRPKGKDDAEGFHGHYISIWSRQPNGEYRAVLDTGINHPEPKAIPTDWKSPADAGRERNDGKLSAADSSTRFYTAVESQGAIKAYKTFLADDVWLMRQGIEPLAGKKAALAHLRKDRSKIVFAKRKFFVEAPDLAYVYNIYAILDKSGAETERGNFVQVWKLRGGKWLIVADAFIPISKKTN